MFRRFCIAYAVIAFASTIWYAIGLPSLWAPAGSDDARAATLFLLHIGGLFAGMVARLSEPE